MVEKNETNQPLEPEDALSLLRQKGGREGRILAKAFVRLKAGRVKHSQLKIGIMAATLVLQNESIKKSLMGYWADLTGSLV